MLITFLVSLLARSASGPNLRCPAALAILRVNMHFGDLIWALGVSTDSYPGALSKCPKGHRIKWARMTKIGWLPCALRVSAGYCTAAQRSPSCQPRSMDCRQEQVYFSSCTFIGCSQGAASLEGAMVSFSMLDT